MKVYIYHYFSIFVKITDLGKLNRNLADNVKVGKVGKGTPLRLSFLIIKSALISKDL